MKHFLHLICVLIWSAAFSQTYSIAPISPANYSFFSPAFYKSNLVICGNHKDRITRTILDENNNEPTDLYQLTLDSANAVKAFSDILRTDFHDGPIAFSKNEDFCVVSSNFNLAKGLKSLTKQINVMSLFSSRLINGKWSPIERLPFVDSIYTYTHPALSADGKMLYFSSDRPGGYGGFDIWMCQLVNGKWGVPVNLGLYVNSEHNEVFPTIHGKQLIFSRDAKDGFGGLDLYKVITSDRKNAQPLPAPLNSEFDDFGLITKDNLLKGYFTTNRNGHDQIFSFHFDFPEFVNCNEVVNDNFCYTLAPEEVQSVTQPSLKYRWSINDSVRYGVEIYHCFTQPGDYHLAIDIIDTVLNEVYFNQATYDITLAYTEQVNIDIPDTLFVNNYFLLSTRNSYLPDFIPNEYYWQIGNEKWIGERQTYKFDTIGTYEIQVGVIGSLNGNSARYCSTKKITVLSDSGKVHKDKIVVLTNYVEDTTLIKKIEYFTPDNDSVKVTYSIEIFRGDSIGERLSKMFRNLEGFEVQIEFAESVKQYLAFVGNYETLSEAHTDWKKLKESGFNEAIVRALYLEDPTIFIEKVFQIEKIHFDSDKYDIKPEAYEGLQKLADILQRFPDFSLEISAFTDSTGSEAHNLQLSDNRANSVKKWLEKQGISSERISSKGFGQEFPIASNKTEEGKQLNRRVEFKIIIPKHE